MPFARACTPAIYVFLTAGALIAHQPHDPIVTVAVSPNFAQDQTVLAATDDLSIKIGAYALLKSTDKGITWSVVRGMPNNGRMLAIAFSPGYAQDQTVFVAGSGGLFKTTDQGTTWSQMQRTFLQNVALSSNYPNDHTLFIVTSQSTILKSTDGGSTWTSIPVPSPLTSGLTVIAVSPDYATDNTLLLGTNADGIFRSTNGGGAWNLATSGMTLPAVTALAISPGFASDQTAIAATMGSGVLVSANGGNSWLPSNSGLTDLNITALSLSPNYLQDSSLWICANTSGVFQSSSGGASWSMFSTVSRALSNLVPIHYQAVASSINNGSPFVVLGMYEGLWVANGVPSFQYVDTIPTRLVRYINISPAYAQDQTIFASTYGGGNLWSTDGGTTWKFQNTGMQVPYTDASGISPDFSADGTAFSAMGYGLQRSSDHGVSWQRMNALGAITYPRALAVSPNFAQDSTVLIGTNNGNNGIRYPKYVTYQGQQYPNQGLFLSLDGGNNWIPTSLGGPPMISAAFSPAFSSDRTAFAASSSSGLYKSTDGGMTWTLLTLPPKSTQMAKVAVSPAFATDHVVFAAFIGGGIYKSKDAGSTWSEIPQTNAVRANDIEFSPNYAFDHTLFVGTVQLGLMKSTNGGVSLLSVTTYPDNFVTAVGVSPNFTNDNTVFAASYHGLFKSTDAGTTWVYLAEPARIEETRNITSTNDQQPPTITFQGLWSHVSPNANSSTDGYMSTAESQDTATLLFLGSGVRWVSQTGPKQGSASIQLDGVSEGTVSLNKPANHYQQAVWERRGLSCVPHSFVVTALPQAGQSVTVDAFDIWVDTCPFANLPEPH